MLKHPIVKINFYLHNFYISLNLLIQLFTLNDYLVSQTLSIIALTSPCPRFPLNHLKIPILIFNLSNILIYSNTKPQLNF